MKFFKLSKTKRLVVLVITMIAVILTIIFGSTFYVSKNARKSIEYGGGSEYLVQVEGERSDNNRDLANQVAESIYERVNGLGVNGITAEAQYSDNEASIRVVSPGTVNPDDVANFKSLISEKPQLVLTDFYGNPLFNENGRFNTLLSPGTDPGGWVMSQSMSDFYAFDPENQKHLKTQVPIASNGASSQLQADGTRYVQVELSSSDAALEWSKATLYISQLPENKKNVLAWLDPHKLIYKLQKFYDGLISPTWNQQWSVISNPANGFSSLAKVITNNQVTNTYSTVVGDASQYLISEAQVAQQLSGKKFTITGTFSSDQAHRLARNINYGASNYSLRVKYSNIIDPEYGASSFNKAMIAGIVVFFLIALILIVNYGLLGVLSTFSIGLFLFMTLAMFTLMRGEYSPEAIAALIIGIGMSVDASIITFERLKSELYAQSSLKKAFAHSNKRSFSTIFDSNITTLIVAVVLFYFGTRTIIGLSVTLILSIIFTLLIMLLFTRFAASLLVKSEVVKNHKLLIGLKPKIDVKTQDTINKFDFVKNAKWFAWGSMGFALIGIIIFIVFASINSSFTGGFNLSQDFTGGSSVVFTPNYGAFSQVDITKIQDGLINSYGIDAGDINVSSEIISFKTKQIFADVNIFESLASDGNAVASISITSNVVAQQLVRDAIIGISVAMGAIIIYTLIRFKWTYSLAAIIALLHDALFVTFAFVIIRMEISPIFIAALLSVIGYSINDTIVTFDRIREKVLTHTGAFDQGAIKKLANTAVKETFKRSLWTSLTTILAVIILMSFGNATALAFNIAMLVGLISGTYSSIFIATFIWTKLENRRQLGIIKRKKKGFWNIGGVEEQTISGINDFKV